MLRGIMLLGVVLVLLAIGAQITAITAGVVLPSAGVLAVGSISVSRGNPDIYLLDVGRGLNVPLIAGAAADTSPAWSPDGRQIAFVREEYSRYYVFRYDLTARQAWYVVEGALSGGIKPAWSPDGMWIVYECDGETRGICRVRIDGTHIERLSSGTSLDTHPVYTPDGSAIVFSATTQVTADLYRLDLETRVVTPLLFTPTVDEFSAAPLRNGWVYTASTGYDWDIVRWVLPLEEGAPLGERFFNLTSAPGNDQSIAVRADGWLAWVRNTREVWVMHVDGHGLRRVAQVPTHDPGGWFGALAWQPVR